MDYVLIQFWGDGDDRRWVFVVYPVGCWLEPPLCLPQGSCGHSVNDCSVKSFRIFGLDNASYSFKPFTISALSVAGGGISNSNQLHL